MGIDENKKKGKFEIKAYLKNLKVIQIILALLIPALAVFLLYPFGDEDLDDVSTASFNLSNTSSREEISFSSTEASVYMTSLESSGYTPTVSPTAAPIPTVNAAKTAEISAASEARAFSPILTEKRSRQILLNTSEYFISRKEILGNSMKNSEYYYEKICLDEESGTYAYILALDKNFAANLNGFFYYLADETASTEYISPIVLNLSILFTEDNRAKCVKNETYAQQDLLVSLENSLKAFLGDLYRQEVMDLIYGEYKYLFDTRLAGEKLPIYTKQISLPGVDILFRNSFTTYIEFFITK